MNKAQGKIVDRLLEAMEQGIIPWKRPWMMPTNAVSGKPYRGINKLVLSLSNFTDHRFVTFLQAKDLGGNVKQGEKGFPIIVWHFPTAQEIQNDPNASPWARSYTVFSVEQCEGLTKLPVLPTVEHDSISEAQAIVDGWTGRPRVEFGGFRACYNTATDTVSMPEIGKFQSAEGYYDTFFHELVHSTGHIKRLDRKSLVDRHQYAIEELVAEVGGAMLCSEAHINNTDLIDNNVAYLQSWLQALKNDKTMLVKAASAAAKASDMIMGRSYCNEEPLEAAQAVAA